MSPKPMRVIAAASFFLASGLLLCLGRPAEALSASSSQTQDQNARRNPYTPARAASAADVQFPFQTAADGVVVFDVSLDAGGEVRNISVLNDVPPFTATARQSLRDWRFAAASQDGRPEDSEMLVAFVFRHAVYIANEPPFTPIIPSKDSAETRRGFIPPAILSISYAGYPASTIAMGAVVVQVSVKTGGSAGNVSVLRNLQGGFTPLALKAAKHWKFQAALRDGRPVPSKVAIAFVFSSRSLNPF